MEKEQPTERDAASAHWESYLQFDICIPCKGCKELMLEGLVLPGQPKLVSIFSNINFWF